MLNGDTEGFNIPDSRKNHVYLCEDCRGVFDINTTLKEPEIEEDLDGDTFYVKSDIYDS